jgi:CMP-N-acetylneuraminic acid synthetase
MLEVDNLMGEQLRPHNLYRRQDYPKVFEISHFIAIFNVDELENLNDNLYNNNTIFYPIKDIIDVDTKNDLDKFIK